MNDMQKYVPLIGRLFLCSLFVQSFYQHAGNPAGTIGYIGKFGLPAPTVAYGVDLCIEGLGVLSLVLGWKARWAGLVLAVYCVFTAAIFHSNFADGNQMFHFMKNMTMTGGFLFLVAFGPGGFSLDNRRG